MTTCEPLPDGGEDDQPLTLWPEDAPASPSPARAGASRRTTRGGYGPRWRRSFADYDPATRSWRTFQGSLLAEWEAYMAMRERIGRESVSSLAVAVQMWPTPRSQNAEPRNHKIWRRPDGEPQNLENAIAAADPSAIGGLLNPEWVEWLMGYPEGWTDCGD